MAWVDQPTPDDIPAHQSAYADGSRSGAFAQRCGSATALDGGRHPQDRRLAPGSRRGSLNARALLRAVHVAEEVARVAGGVPAVVRQLSERLLQNGARVQVVHANGDPSELPLGVESRSFPPTGIGRTWYWGRGLQEGLAQLATASSGDAPVFHLHGVWSAPQYFAARAAHRASVPFVFSAHGMLEPWLWNEQGWRTQAKKRAYWKVFAYPALSKARVV